MNEGCQVAGEIVVNKVAGNFHIAIGKGIKYGPKHVHHFNVSEITEFNSSHIINKLSFGSSFSGYKDPLEGTVEILKAEDRSYSGHFEYFLQVIPTTFINRYGYQTLTSQYSTTVHYSRVESQNTGSFRLPGIFFIYKLSPFMVRVEELTPSFLQFLTSICAIVGGVITVSGIIDSFVFHTYRGTGVLSVISPRARIPSNKGLLD